MNLGGSILIHLVQFFENYVIHNLYKGITMRAIIQRVKSAEIFVDHQRVSQIGRGILTLLGISHSDTEENAEKLIRKICELRIFENQDGKLDLSVKDIQGSHLIVSQFTLMADCSKGKRPSFLAAAKPDMAKVLYDKAIEISKAQGVHTEGGVFQAHMEVSLVNDGPATFVIDV